MNSVLLWLPRVAAACVAIFLGLFALDTVTGPRLAVLLHLAPSFIVIALIALSWRRPLIGATAFLLLALLYSFAARRPDWILVIAGPLVVVSLLYSASWYHLFRGPAPD